MSDSEMECSDDEYSEDEGGREDWLVMEQQEAQVRAAAAGKFSCLSPEQVDKMLNESIDRLSHCAGVTPAEAKVMLHAFNWNTEDLIQKYKENPEEILVKCKVKPAKTAHGIQAGGGFGSPSLCNVCACDTNSKAFRSLDCAHSFCVECWGMHFEVQIAQGVSTSIGCMALNCEIRAPEDFVLSLVHQPKLRDRYQQFCFQDYVKSHPELRYCPGANCQVVIQGKGDKAGPVTCKSCGNQCCFRCGVAPHAPADCSLIKKWFTKCADDSETANYISAHTKDCPACRICIEKNGGCNHMQCSGCRHDFCWMCLGEWRTHGSEYYECSKYRENPNVSHDSQHTQAREALKKYLHYYERWENHAKSLRLEEQTLENLRNKIDEKVKSGAGTWIDWQPYFNGADLLARCRYTLQYTYPYAYYMEPGRRKNLFEYQQAQLEAEIENLSWIIERAETTDIGELQKQMHIAEKQRTNLLEDFQDG